MKIVMLSHKDFGNSGWHILQALKRLGHSVYLVKISHNRLKRLGDFVFEDVQYKAPSVIGIRELITQKRKHNLKYYKIVQKAINEADVIHFKGDEPPRKKWFHVTIPDSKKTVVTVGGSNFRRKSRIPLAANALYPIEEYWDATIRTALTADLNYKEFKGIYTQQAIDSEAKETTWKAKKIPIIAHSPSSREKKGTDSIFLPAMECLKRKGYHFELDIIEKVSQEECIERKKRATLFFDQCVVGFYGNAALEAMQFGIPTITWISREAVLQSNGKINYAKCPVISPEPTVESFVKYMERFLSNPQRQKKLSERTKTFCDSFHSYRAVGKMWEKIYKGEK